MRDFRWGAVFAIALVAVLGGAVVIVWFALRPHVQPTPGCVVLPYAAADGSGGSATAPNQGSFDLSPDQADNAATIAAVGIKLGMPDHAVTVALATALQESKLINLTEGDLDSAGLFQQRPSMGWGSYNQVTDPVYASTAFYDKLRTEPGWQDISVTRAAQLVQHSAAPDAYAQWEPEARALASALTGESVAALSCHDIAIPAPSADLAATARAEFGSATVQGTHNAARGWAIGSWLVAHAARLGVDKVTFDGQTWTAASGTWAHTGPADGLLTLHQVSAQVSQPTSG